MKFNSKKTNQGLGIWEVVIDSDSWKTFLINAEKTLIKNMQLQGFRKGKVPISMAVKYISQSELLKEASRMAVKKGHKFALEQNTDLKPISKIDCDIVELSDTKCVLEFKFDIKPEINIQKYKGYTQLVKNQIKVTPKIIAEELKKVQERFTILQNKEGKVELSDHVLIDFVGKIDDKEFEGNKAINYGLDIGSNTFIPGFETALIGWKIGTKKVIKLVFPEDYHVENLRSKPVTFDVTLKEIKTKIIPDLNDELISDLKIKDVTTVAQYKQYIKTKLEEKLVIQEKNRFVSVLLDTIAVDSNIIVPYSIIVGQRKLLFKEFERKINAENINVKDYCKKTGLSIDDINKELEIDAKKMISQYYILEHVTTQEKITVSADEIKNEYKKLTNKFSLAENDKKIKEYFPESEIINSLKKDKIIDFLFENN